MTHEPQHLKKWLTSNPVCPSCGATFAQLNPSFDPVIHWQGNCIRREIAKSGVVKHQDAPENSPEPAQIKENGVRLAPR